MKKVLFLQNNGKSFGGVWQVNKLIGEALIEKGYDVSVIAIRNNKTDLEVKHHEKLHVDTINKELVWGTYTGSDIVSSIRKFKIITSLKMITERIKYNYFLKKDVKKLHQFIEEYQPNYIITTHYQILDMIPKNYLKNTIHCQHSSFNAAINHKATRKTFDKYKNKIKFLWLTKNAMNLAKEYGIQNSTYIYNAVRFTTDKTADVIKNKKLITIARISKDKNITGMVDICKKLFNDKSFHEWSLEIYGEGSEINNIKALIGENKQIKLMGLTDNPKEKLLSASINLNTSPYEGFCLSILEANECGIPTIAFDFGESVTEEIIDGKTGIIARNPEDYLKKLKELINNPVRLKELSQNCKEFNKQFNITVIVNKWMKLFASIDERVGE